jgi:hypothetical protein
LINIRFIVIFLTLLWAPASAVIPASGACGGKALDKLPTQLNDAAVRLSGTLIALRIE